MISPALQRASQEQWARANGRRITGWVTDLDATGRNFRRKVTGLIERVKRGEVREIIVYRYDRWGRNTAQALAHVHEVEQAGGSVISATEPLDAETAIGKYNRANAFAMAQMQSDIIGENWKAVMKHRTEAGLPAAGRAARFGYRRLGRVRDEADPRPRTRKERGEDERYVPDPALGQVLAGMYRAYTSGEGSTVIARRLNEAGVPNTEGRLWSGRTVLGVLDSGFGAGLLRIHPRTCRCPDGGRCRERTYSPGRQEAVITEPEWAAYRARRDLTAGSHEARARAVYPVTGLARCAGCGGALAATGNPAGQVSFRCIRHNKYRDCPGGGVAVPLTVLTEAARAFVGTLAADLDARAATAQARVMVVKGARGDADRIAAQIAAVDRELANLARQAGRLEDIPPEIWREVAREKHAERDQLEKRLAAVTAEAAEADSDPVPAIIGIMQAWDILPGPALNRILRTVVREIRVRRTGPAIRDSKGHYRPQETSVQVIPRWAPAQD